MKYFIQLSKTVVKRILIIAALGAFSLNSASGQESSIKDQEGFNLVFGMNQIMLGGFNIEGNYYKGRFIFDYSHGISLNIDNEFLDPTTQLQGIDVHIPWTTGFGIGYRINDWLNFRAEPKWHKFDLYATSKERTSTTPLLSYQTFTMGGGLYANLKPFEKAKGWAKGIIIVPSIRYWPRISSTLNNNQASFYNPDLDQNISHEALEVGISNTPIILNISIGYSFNKN
jgi:hypothetical protein